ncbi:MAG: hypothetical protein WAN47_09575 [Nitrosotalea sp.]
MTYQFFGRQATFLLPVQNHLLVSLNEECGDLQPLPPEYDPKLLETRIQWEEAREAARSSRDRQAVRELYKARKNLKRAMRQLEEASRNANSTADPELRRKEIEAYEHLLKIERNAKTDGIR